MRTDFLSSSAVIVGIGTLDVADEIPDVIDALEHELIVWLLSAMSAGPEQGLAHLRGPVDRRAPCGSGSSPVLSAVVSLLTQLGAERLAGKAIP